MKINQYATGPLMVNTYLVWDENSGEGFIVDPGGDNEQIARDIQAEGIHLAYVILTHGHGDHIGGVEKLLAEYPEAKLVAAQMEKPMLADADQNMSRQVTGRSIVLYPDLAVTEGETLSVGNLELKFIMTPGHTVGGMCILAGDVLFSGDTLFQQSVGRTDFPGGSFLDLSRSIQEKLYTLPDDTQVFSGHTPPTTIGFEKENNPFVSVR